MEFIKAPLSKIKGTEGDSSSGAMGKLFKASGKMGRKMATESGEVLKAIFMKGNGKITNRMAKEYICTSVVQNILVISKIFSSMEEVKNSFKTEINIRVSIKMVSLTVTANIFGKMEIDIRASLLTDRGKEKGF